MATVIAQQGTFDISTYNPYISGYVQWRETYDSSTYIDTNKTKVEMKAYLHRTNVYDGATYITNTPVTRIMHFGDEQISDTGSVSFSIPGNTSSSGGEYIIVYAASKEITHNADGSKKLNLGFHMWNEESGVAGNSFRVATVRKEVELITIPRASSFGTISGNTIGGQCTVNLDVKSTSFSHALWYKVGNSGWYELGVIAAGKTSHTFTIASETVNQLPNTTSGTMQLCVRTLNGSTRVGNDVYKDVTVYVPGYEISNSGVEINGNNLLEGVYVEGKSFLSVYIGASATSGASIVSYSSVIDGKTYNGNSFNTSTLSSGTHRVETTITDSRGTKTTVSSREIYVHPYGRPVATISSATRNSVDPTKVNLVISGYVFPLDDKNIMSVQVEFNGDTFTIPTSGHSFDDMGVVIHNVPTDDTKTGAVIITDLYNTTRTEFVIGTMAVTMDFYNTGKGIAIGKVAEGDGLEVDWDANFNRKVKIDGEAYFNGVTTFNNSTIFEYAGLGKFVLDSSSMTEMLRPQITFKNGTTALASLTVDSDGNLVRYKPAYGSYRIIDEGNIASFLTSAIADNEKVEYGTDSGWNYEKLDNGTLKLYRNFAVTNVAVNQAWGTLYSSPQITLPTFPTTAGLKFTATPQVHLCWNGSYSAILDGVTGATTTKCGYVYIFRPDTVTLSSGSIAIQVIGKWK